MNERTRRRLERLEAQLAPEGEPRDLHVHVGERLYSSAEACSQAAKERAQAGQPHTRASLTDITVLVATVGS